MTAGKFTEWSICYNCKERACDDTSVAPIYSSLFKNGHLNASNKTDPIHIHSFFATTATITENKAHFSESPQPHIHTPHTHAHRGSDNIPCATPVFHLLSKNASVMVNSLALTVHCVGSVIIPALPLEPPNKTALSLLRMETDVQSRSSKCAAKLAGVFHHSMVTAVTTKHITIAIRLHRTQTHTYRPKAFAHLQNPTCVEDARVL